MHPSRPTSHLSFALLALGLAAAAKAGTTVDLAC